MKKLTAHIFSILILFSSKNLVAQNFPELQFEHLTTKDGLSSNSVSAVTEDKTGFIWIGTSNGLDRYDGYRFKKYFHDNQDSNSLVNNDVQRLYCDSKNRLWICTEAGVSCFLPDENRFINYSSIQAKNHQLLNNSSVGIHEDKEGYIWLSNQENVIFKVGDDYNLQRIKINIPAFAFFNQYLSGYYNIYTDRKNSDWAFKGNRIYKLDKISKQPTETINLEDSIKGIILGIFQDNRDNYFITTYAFGLWQFDPARQTIKKVETSLPANIFPQIDEWEYEQKRWLLSMEINSGFCLIDPVTFFARKYSFKDGDPSSLQGNQFNQFFIDRKQNVWIASNFGVNKIVAEQKLFDIQPITEPGKNNFNLSTNAMVFGYFENDSSIWVSKRGISLINYDKEFRLRNCYYRLYPLSEKDTKSSNGYAYSFFQSGQELYMTTDSGLISYNLSKKTSRVFYPEQKSSRPDLRTIIPLKDNLLMIRSFSNGIFLFDMAAGKFIRQYRDTTECYDCLPLRITYLFKTRNNNIYITSGGNKRNFFKYDMAADKFKPVKPVNDDQYSMFESDLFGMAEDQDGKIWITSKSGIFIYDPQSNTVTDKPATPDQIGSLSRICFDKNWNAWACGNSGVWCYMLSGKKWVGFNGEDGLPGSLYDGLIMQKSNGDIVSGLESCLAIFHPDKIKSQIAEIPVVITEASIGNKLYSFPLLTKGSKTLHLAPGQNYFSVEFAVLNYLSPSSSRYYYMLSPIMKGYELNDNGHLNFNGLSPGSYTLHVKGGDKAGNMYSDEDVISIIVEPGWYQTTWFKLVCAFLLASIIFYFVRRRIVSIRKEAGFKQKIAETEMQALRAQMNPHFIFNSLNSIENFIMQNEKRLASDYLNKFARLIRMILDSSRNELVPISKDMEALQLYIDLEQLRFNNKFTYNAYLDPVLKQGDYMVPSLIIQPYVENAIVHGLAHSEERSLTLNVTATLENDLIKYTIQDNGVGREQAAKYNSQNKPQHKSVGMAITKERINLFNGENNNTSAVTIIDLKDKNNNPAGTRVEINLKLK